MQILEYSYNSPSWSFEKLTLAQINLIVGDSGSGKTRFLNTLFNIALFVAQSKVGPGDGTWEIKAKVGDDEYLWSAEKVNTDEQTVHVRKEQLFLNGEEVFSKNEDLTLFKGEEIPKLSSELFLISHLKEEDLVSPLFNGFSRMMRRRFFKDDLEKAASLVAIKPSILDGIGEKKDLGEVYKSDLSLNSKLYVLKHFFPEIYEEIVTSYIESFPFIDEVEMLSTDDFEEISIPGGSPVFSIKEHGLKNWIRLDELSSGMQKIALILTDLLSADNELIYLIDEYENSLGLSAIHTLPDLLNAGRIKNQIIITSHHPDTIRDFSVDKWIIAHRKGMQVSFTLGDKLKSRYADSGQDKYLQLLNDPEYSGEEDD